MPSSIGIKSVTNDHSGNTATVVLDGVSTGILEFYASELIDSPKIVLPFTGVGPYVLRFPNPDLWYVWAKDDNGFGLVPGASYVGLSDDEDINLIGQFLRNQLDKNRPGMQSLVRTWYPNTTIKSVHWTTAASSIDTPFIVVMDARWDWDWKAVGFIQEWTYTYSINFVVNHAEEEAESPLSTRLATAGSIVLNRRANVKPTLANGLTLYHCQARNGNVTDVEIPDGGGFASVASLVWTGKALKQQGKGSF